MVLFSEMWLTFLRKIGIFQRAVGCLFVVQHSLVESPYKHTVCIHFAWPMITIFDIFLPFILWNH